MNRPRIERCDELGEIVHVGRSTVVLPVVFPWTNAMIPLGIGDKPITFADLLSDRDLATDVVDARPRIGGKDVITFAGSVKPSSRRSPILSDLIGADQADTLAKYVGESGLVTSNSILGASRTVSRFYGRRNRRARRTT